MNRQKRRDTLHFDDDAVFDDQVGVIIRPKLDLLVDDGNRLMLDEPQFPFGAWPAASAARSRHCSSVGASVPPFLRVYSVPSVPSVTRDAAVDRRLRRSPRETARLRAAPPPSAARRRIPATASRP